MPIWNDEYLDYLMTRGEIDFSQKIPCIFTRFSLSTTQGTSVYDLPSGIVDISRLTWKGDPVEPWEHSDDREGGWIKPQNLYSEGKPIYYLAYEYGYAKIKFHPVPYETVGDDDTNIYGSDIANRVIVSAYRVADPSAELYRIPETVRRRFTKYYALEKAFRREGKGQDIQAADYFKRRHDFVVSEFRKIVQKIPAVITIQLGPRDGSPNIKGTPARPTLPTDGAWSF